MIDFTFLSLFFLENLLKLEFLDCIFNRNKNGNYKQLCLWFKIFF